jgi:hypothetical protein
MPIVTAGDTALIQYHTSAKQHLYIFLTREFETPAKTIFINVTTPNDLSDRSILLYHTDHSFIQYESVLSYPHCTIIEVSKIPALIRSGLFTPQQPINTALLKKIQGVVGSLKLVGMDVKLKLNNLSTKTPELLLP